MVAEMSDDNDDLDQLARLFGAQPETPPEGLQRPAEAWPTAAPAAAAPADPLGWLLSDTPATAVLPSATEHAPSPSHSATTLAEPTQVLPTRRGIAAEAARASRDAGRRNLIILGSTGGVVLILLVVLIVVLVAKNSSSGSPEALLKQTPSPSRSASSSAAATPTASASASETPTPAPAPTEAPAAVAPAPSAPTVTASVTGQVDCTSGPTTISIAYTTTNAATLNLASSDGSVNTNLTPAASGTISSVLYQCDGSGESYTLTAYSSAEGVTPATATVTPVPAG